MHPGVHRPGEKGIGVGKSLDDSLSPKKGAPVSALRFSVKASLALRRSHLRTYGSPKSPSCVPTPPPAYLLVLQVLLASPAPLSGPTSHPSPSGPLLREHS